MSTMTKDQTTNDDQNIQVLTSQLNDLADEANDLNKEIEESNKETEQAMDDLEAEVNVSINNVEEIYSDLDKIESESGDELDKLILEQSQDLASE